MSRTSIELKVSESKKALRKLGRQSVPDGARERERLSNEICRLLLESKQIKQAQNIGIYFPRASEVDLREVWLRLSSHCAFPRVVTTQRELVFYRVDLLEQLSPGYGAILEPPADVKKRVENWTNRDIVLIPGLLFDRWGGRLGSGKGIYDRFLGHAGQSVQKWGICWPGQISSQRLPQGEKDVPMDAIVSEGGIESIGSE